MDAQENFSILLVDDDAMVVRILSRILSEFVPLRFATSGQSALKLARQSTPDLVLLDVDMPEFSGFEVCKAFKADAALKEVPIIFITGHESVELETKGLELGAADFIRKPPNASLVLARVRTYQRLKSLSDTLRSSVTLDFLTGSIKRRQLERALAQEWLRAQRSGTPLALLLIDIEGFVAYNTEFGEERGDDCLKAVAEALHSVARRPTDTLGRWGGGRFAFLLPETDTQGADTIARRAIEAVDALQIPSAIARGGEPCVSIAVGGGCRAGKASLTLTAPESLSRQAVLAGAVSDDLIAAAEHALAGVRATGGHRVRIVELEGARTTPVLAIQR